MNVAVRNLDMVRLRHERDELKEQVRQLQDMLAAADVDVSAAWKLTGSEAALYRDMEKRKGVRSKQQLHFALYGFGEDDPDPKIVDVLICKLRAKIEPFGGVIETRWGVGYELTHKPSVPDLCLAEPSSAGTPHGLVAILLNTAAYRRGNSRRFISILRCLALADGHMLTSAMIADAIYGPGHRPKSWRSIVHAAIRAGRVVVADYGWEIEATPGVGGGYRLRRKRGGRAA